MNSKYLEDNFLLNDILKHQNCHEYKTIVEAVSKYLHHYFMKNYKKLRYNDFEDTNDYYIQNIKFFINTLQREKSLAVPKYGQCLQNFILSIEKPVMMSSDNKMIKSSISNLRSFLIKNRQQNSLIYHLGYLEEKSKDNCDYLLLLEKLCVLLKSIFEVVEIKQNHKFDLYKYLNKCLTEEKFLHERKVLTSRNKIMSVRTLVHNNYDILPKDVHKALDDKETDKKLFYRSNTIEEEERQKHDNKIFETINNDKLFEKKDEGNFRIFYTNDPDEPNEINLYSSEPSSRNVDSCNRNQTNGFLLLNSNYSQNPNKFLNLKNSGIKSFTPSINSCNLLIPTPKFKEQSVDIVFNFQNEGVIGNFIKTHKKVRLCRGDKQQVEEFPENIFELMPKSGNPRELLIEVNRPPKPRQSIISQLMSKDEMKALNDVRERSPTPNNEKADSIYFDHNDYKPEKQMKRSMSKENVTSSTSHRNMKVDNEQTKQIHKTQKMYAIHSDSNSTIKLPPNFITPDADLKLLCDLVNEPTDKGWKKVIEDKNLKIHKRTVEGFPQILIKTVAILNGFSKEEIFEAISNVNIRMQWDKIFSEFKVVETNVEEQSEVLYMSIKSPSIFVADRDFVQKRKIWKHFPDSDSIILHFKSISHKLCPEKPKFVRADTIISGYYIKTLGENPHKTLVSIISQTDIKGSIPTWIVNSVAQKAPKEWVNNLIKGCEKVKANQKVCKR